MKGNFAAVALTVIGVIALAVNLDLIESPCRKVSINLCGLARAERRRW
jgi:hypothetical protein